MWKASQPSEIQVNVRQSLLFSRLFVSDSMTPRTAAHQASLSFTISLGLLILMSIESVMSSNHLILCCPLLLLPSIFPSLKVFSSESALCIRWPNMSLRFHRWETKTSHASWPLKNFLIKKIFLMTLCLCTSHPSGCSYPALLLLYSYRLSPSNSLCNLLKYHWEDWC